MLKLHVCREARREFSSAKAMEQENTQVDFRHGKDGMSVSYTATYRCTSVHTRVKDLLQHRAL